MKRIIGVVVAVVVLGGCAAPKEATKDSGASGPVSSSTPDNGPTPDPITTPTNHYTPTVTVPPDDPDVAKVGATEWFTYEDGLKVQVTKLTRFKIGEYAAGGTPGGPGVVVTVTIRNGTAKTADLSLTTVKVSYGANGDQADQVYDSEHGIGGGFEGSATPGKAKTAKFGFAVPKGRQVLDVEVEPGFLDYDSSHFEGSVK